MDLLHIDESLSPAQQALKGAPEIKDQLTAALAFQDSIGGLKQVEVDGETYIIKEGDLVFDEDQFRIYVQQRQQEALAGGLAEQVGLGSPVFLSPPGGLADRAGLGSAVWLSSPVPATQTRGLVGVVQGSKIVRWGPGTALSYCVLRQTFPNAEAYQAVVQNMTQATADWENACGVAFQYRQDLDSSVNLRPTGLLFTVRYIDAGGAFIAAAFFPNDPVTRRKVLIDPSYYDNGIGYDQAGVLRHELGHVLGFRHEQIRSGAPPICPDEDPSGTIDLTHYDPSSVMHYFCGGAGTRTMVITEWDRLGAQRVYGPPLTSFYLVESA